MPHIPIQQLTDFGTRIFVAAGAQPHIALRVADALVKSDVFGVHSHGTNLLPQYVLDIAQGEIKPAALPFTVKDGLATALVDGQRGFGHVTGEFATRLAIDKALANGVGIVSCVNTNHIGRIGEYPEMMVEAGLIGFCIVNAGPIVTPFGGLGRRLGTNPIAFAVPIPGGHPLRVDFATSGAAGNKVLVARSKGIRIPKGWVLDSEGADSTDPADLFNGGYLLPFGAHKGYGLGVMVEILAGLLSGTGSAVYGSYHGGNGVFMLALSPEFFRPPQEFLDDVRRLVEALRSTPPREGVEKVMVPGDPEAATEERYRRDGIELDAGTWKLIVDAGLSVGVRL
jgi:LDH2 family malate/lactate/ureidoglycolate dehydrogenase